MASNFWVEGVDPDALFESEVGWSNEIDLLMGYPAGSVSRTIQTFMRHVHPDDLPGILGILDEALEWQVPYQASYRLYRADGSVVHVLEQGTFEYGPDGEPVRLIGVAQDVTRQALIQDLLDESF